MPRLDLRQLWGVWAIGTLSAGLLLGFFPSLDLQVSALFFQPDHGFWLSTFPGMSFSRFSLWYASLALVVLSFVGLSVALFWHTELLGFPARVWGFIFALYVIAPGIIVNVGLKELWGRARPAAIVEFGGAHAFTPFWQVAQECASNCSFVSGEGAAAMALGVSLIVLIRFAEQRLPPALVRPGLWLGVFLPVLGAAQRLITGRHFLSDMLMAIAIVTCVALVLHALLLRRPEQNNTALASPHPLPKS
jgi:lipid A 4'-phosphatase